MIIVCLLFVKQKTAYEMRISDWSSDVCSSDLRSCLRRCLPATGGAGSPPACPLDAFTAHAYARPADLEEVGALPCPSASSSPTAEIGRASCWERVCLHV